MNHPPDRRETTNQKKGAPPQTEKRPLLNFADPDNDTIDPPRQVRSFTTGRSVFYCPLAGSLKLSEIRNQLELKLAACVFTGGTNGFPLEPDRVRNPQLRALIAHGMLGAGWSTKDLAECHGMIEGTAASVLLATLEKPVWGRSDLQLFGLIERIESFQRSAWRSGLTL